MSISRKNSEQYPDPTAYAALTAVERLEKRKSRSRRKFMPLEEKINADIDELVSLKSDITKAIGTVNDPEESLLLTLRYLNYKTWEEIADELDCSVRKVHIVHSKALSDVIIPVE